MIPVRNIYHMLSYAWENTLDRGIDESLDKEAFDNIYNLLTSLLVIGVSRLVRQGFLKGYEPHNDDLTTLRGKVNLPETIGGKFLSSRRLSCSFDEFTEDIVMNRIIRSTLSNLTRCEALDNLYRYKCTELLRHFHGVGDIDLNEVSWNRLLYSRHSNNYRMIVGICELINCGLISTEEKGRVRFASYIKDAAMAKLYEKFILNFYRKELKECRVYSGHIEWQLDSVSEDNLLPTMKTDVEIEGPGGKLIIDAKYYKSALITSYRSEAKTLISHNLYQIFAYVKNDPYQGQKSGMLLYPTVEHDLNQMYNMSGNHIFVSTINLAAPFQEVRSRLLQLAGYTGIQLN
jgi:5-methylcytosine-specific restriction enzyme subunit McrC